MHTSFLHKVPRERRRWPRVDVDRQVVIYQRNARSRCRCMNLSAGGAAIDAEDAELMASQVRVNIPLEEGHTIALDGRIVGAHRQGPRRIWHLRFEKVPTSLRARLASFVESRASQRRGPPAPDYRRDPS